MRRKYKNVIDDTKKKRVSKLNGINAVVYHEFDHDFALCLFLSLSFLSFCFLRIPKLLSLTSIYEQGVFEETLNTLQKKIDDMKKTQAQCEETIRLKNNFMVIKLLS